MQTKDTRRPDPPQRSLPLPTIAIALAVALLLTAGLIVVARQASVRTAALEDDVRALSARLDESRQESRALRTQSRRLTETMTTMQGEAAEVGRELDAVIESVGELDSDFREAVDRALDPAAVAASALDSVLTVECFGTGTGFALTGGPEGRTQVVTNHHVIDACIDSPAALSVRKGRQQFASTLASWDPASDLAVVMIEAEVPPLKVADAPIVGDGVVAIGSPLGLEDTVTTGVISRIRRDWFQTSAPINPGNSGGPLLDRDGNVLGVNTRKLVSTGYGGPQAEGLGFAVRMRVACTTVVDCG